MTMPQDVAQMTDGADLEHDFTDDQLKPQSVLDHLRAHDDRMRHASPDWALAKAIYTTGYWKYLRGQKSSDSTAWTNWIDVEVNRLFPIVGSYLAALYPRAQRSIVVNDPASMTGDAEKAQIANNRWLAAHRIHQRVMSGIRQAIIYPGCGAKVGYSPGRGNPLDRVWLRVIPWWELVLDFDVNDPEDQRFVGHVYYQLKSKIEEEYGLKGLTGTRRDDFLDTRPSGTNDAKKESGRGKKSKADVDERNFVRVLELVNFQDDVQDPSNPEIVYKGRLEIYILGQGGGLSKKPVWMGPLPMAKYDGMPLSHIVPLVFNHEPEYPLRGIAHSQRMLPQMQEMNAYRAFMAMSTRKDSRQYMTRKGTFGADVMTKITEGIEGYIAEVETDFERPLNDAILPIPNSPLSVNIDRYMRYVETDLERTTAQSPQARGEITKATAFEIQTVQQYTESEFGMHAAIKDQWLAEILRVFIRALMSAMQDSGDYAGAYDEQEVSLLGVGAMPDTGDSLGEPEKAKLFDDADIAESTGKQDPPIAESLIAPALGVKGTKPPREVVQQTLQLKDPRGDIVEISVEDLDAEFEISFVEGGRTPLTDAAMQQNLMALLQPYMALWQTASQGGPMGVFAKAYMQVLAERYDLPKDLHPQQLESRMASAAPPPQASTEGGEPAEEAAPAGPQDLQRLLSDILQMPPSEAVAVLAKLFENDDQMTAVLAKVSEAPPEQQAMMIEEIVNAMLEGAPAGGGAAAQPPPLVDDGAPKGGGPAGAPIPAPTSMEGA